MKTGLEVFRHRVLAQLREPVLKSAELMEVTPVSGPLASAGNRLLAPYFRRHNIETGVTKGHISCLLSQW